MGGLLSSVIDETLGSEESRPAGVRSNVCTKKDSLIYDVGLHKGEDTAFYLAKGFEVVAFEANPALVQSCRARFADAIATGRLTIVEGAVVDEAANSHEATVTFYRNDENSVWGTAVPHWAERNELLGSSSHRISVPAVKMSQCLQQFGVPYYMKIDIEGADLFCLRALERCEVRPDYVSLESEKRVFKGLVEEFRLLETLGYSRFKIVQQAAICEQSAPECAREGAQVSHRFEEGASGLFGLELPGRWLTRNLALLRYTWISVLYRMFGDYGVLSKSRVGEILRRVLAKLLQQPIPGWYDTHARHGSIVGPNIEHRLSHRYASRLGPI